MSIRVGTILYNGGKRYDPSLEGFTPILVLTKSSAYGSLGPYVLKDEQGRIMENLYQAAKVYAEVPASKQIYSRYDPTIIWDHPKEQHVSLENGNWILEPAYFNWRDKLQNCPYPVRYPVGMQHRHKCLFALAEDKTGTIDFTPLDYIESRKKIYAPIYIRLVRKEKQYHQLKTRLEKGENLLIMEVDGPHEESLPYYKSTYGMKDDFIENNTMLVTAENIQIMLNDSRHPFGHGYCLAAALLDIKLE